MKQNAFGSSTESEWEQKSQSEWHRQNMTIYKVSYACHRVRESKAWGLFCADLCHSTGLKVLYRVIILWKPLRSSRSVLGMSQLEVLTAAWSLHNKACFFVAVRYIRSEPVCFLLLIIETDERTTYWPISPLENTTWTLVQLCTFWKVSCVRDFPFLCLICFLRFLPLNLSL